MRQHRSMPGLGRAMVLLVALAGLGACDSPHRQAREHVTRAVALLQASDPVAAQSELERALELAPHDSEARLLLAGILRSQGAAAQALQQYLTALDDDPGQADAARAVIDLAIGLGQWDLAEARADALLALAPDDPAGQSARNALDYRRAALKGDNVARHAAAERAAAQLAARPDIPINAQVVVDSLMRDGNYADALAAVAAAQSRRPDDPALYWKQLQILMRLDDRPRSEAVLKQMLAQFPDDAAIPAALVRFYTGNRDLDAAEAFLRGRIRPKQPDDGARTAFLQFLAENGRPGAAIAQAEDFIEEGTNDALFHALHASLLFDAGQQDAAVAEIEAVLETAPEDAQTDRIRSALAELLMRQDNIVGARAAVETVLRRDPTMPEALRLRAALLIQTGAAEQALTDLNAALLRAPRNAAILRTMASAYLSLGDPTLAGERLALAVDASGRAPADSVAYARFLVATGKVDAALAVLADAMELAPGNVALLSETGRIRLQQGEWVEATGVEDALRAIGTPAAIRFADRLHVALLKAQDRDADALAYLEQLGAADSGDLGVQVAILQDYLESGAAEAARDHAAQLVRRDPDNPDLLYLQAATSLASGDRAAAENEYAALVGTGRASERAWIDYLGLLAELGRGDERATALDSALAAYPDSAPLLWLRAEALRASGRIGEALQAYGALYARVPANLAVANNLASLLSTERSDDDSLLRASEIARPLRDSPVPAYRDTYGWIAYRLADYPVALDHLESAAASLPDEPLVQFHLAMTYLALGRRQEAATAFERVASLTRGAGGALAEIADAHLRELR